MSFSTFFFYALFVTLAYALVVAFGAFMIEGTRSIPFIATVAALSLALLFIPLTWGIVQYARYRCAEDRQNEVQGTRKTW